MKQRENGLYLWYHFLISHQKKSPSDDKDFLKYKFSTFSLSILCTVIFIADATTRIMSRCVPSLHEDKYWTFCCDQC